MCSFYLSISYLFFWFYVCCYTTPVNCGDVGCWAWGKWNGIDHDVNIDAGEANTWFTTPLLLLFLLLSSLLLLLVLLLSLNDIQLLISCCVDFHINYFTLYESYDGCKDKKLDELCCCNYYYYLFCSAVLSSTLSLSILDFGYDAWTTYCIKGSVMRCNDMVSWW